MENKIRVELLNAQVLDFKTNDGSIIKGLKIFYYDSEIKEGFINGKIESSYFNTDKISNYKEVFESLREYYLDKRRSGEIPEIDLYFTIKSIKDAPLITKIDLVQ